MRKECSDHPSAFQAGGEGLDLWQEAADHLRSPSAALCQHLHKGEVLKSSVFHKVSAGKNCSAESWLHQECLLCFLCPVLLYVGLTKE